MLIGKTHPRVTYAGMSLCFGLSATVNIGSAATAAISAIARLINKTVDQYACTCTNGSADSSAPQATSSNPANHRSSGSAYNGAVLI